MCELMNIDPEYIEVFEDGELGLEAAIEGRYDCHRCTGRGTIRTGDLFSAIHYLPDIFLTGIPSESSISNHCIDQFDFRIFFYITITDNSSSVISPCFKRARPYGSRKKKS